MRLTKALKAAGIVEIGLKNTNGSYNCRVQLSKIDLTDSTTNFRGQDDRHVADIASDFHLPSVRNPLLVLNNGTLASVDGRHTVCVLRQETNQRIITADVFFDLGEKDAALAFYHLTMSGKRMNPWSAFNAALTGKMKWATTINAALNEYQYTTPLNKPGKTSYADVNSIDPFHEAFNRDDTGGLVDGLAELLFAFADNGKVNKVARTCPFLRGLLDFLIANKGKFTVSELAARLGKRSAEQYLELANDYASDTGRAERSHFRKAFETLALAGKIKLAA